MIVESKSTRRGFVAAAAAVAGVAAFAATRDVLRRTGTMLADGSIRWDEPVASPTPLGSADAWQSAIGSSIRINGEQGMVDGRILAVDRGATGGPRPSGVRTDALLISFETDMDRAPAGDVIYGVETIVPGVRELFMIRGGDVLGRATFLAVLN